MAGSSLLALIDDITTILDDVAMMTKVAAKKTAGVLGDDLALNAQQVTGVNAERELPVVWAVAVGSLKNKAILVPLALAISALIPWAVTPLLMIGGAYLCFEGVEKLAHKFLHSHHEEAVEEAELLEAVADPAVDLVALEKDKIQGAVRTDFILSAEIITISLGTVAGEPFLEQVAVLVGISLLMTVGVYGLVAGIVKLDDLGLYLNQKKDAVQRSLGQFLLLAAPWLMKTLSVVGTAAMFMVGGGILTHGIHALHDIIHTVSHSAHGIPVIGGFLEKMLIPTLIDMAVGLVAGILVLLVVNGVGRVIASAKGKPSSAH
ncbi:MAG: DUF808 domain-containing protein [Candidatus Sericytochromatia bacterium]